MTSRTKKTRYRPGTIGSKLNSTERDKLLNLRKANQTKVKVVLKTQRAKTLSWKTKKKPRKSEPRESLESADSRFEYWDFPEGLSCRDSLPSVSSQLDCSHLETILKHGGESAIEDQGEELFVNLGIDFGTSSTKIIARFPLEPGEPAIAIPAPGPCRVDDFPHLWRTALWITNNGEAFMWPVPHSKTIATLKQDLLLQTSNSNGSSDFETFVPNHEQAATAYLAYVIRYSRGWLRRERPQAFEQRNAIWRINVGMPTASFDEPTLAELYRKVAAAALLLADLDIQIETASTELVLQEPEILEAGQTVEKAQELGIGVVPESAAEMTGFAKSPSVAEGLYMLIDIGALTLDVSMFNLHSNKEMSQIYSFMDAQVRPLGVESYFWFLNHGKLETEFVEQCDRTLLSVVSSTRRRRRPFAPNWNAGEDVPIFLVGGGAKFELHRRVIDGLNSWMRQEIRNDGIRRVYTKLSNTLDSAGLSISHDRMGVAWGLSYDFNEIGEIRPMSDIEDIVRSDGKQWRSLYPGKEQM